MSYFNLNTIYTAIDIGTTKICTIIAQCDDNGIDILGIGITPSDGLQSGIIVDMNKAITSIKNSLDEAKLMASFESESAYVGISGHHIRSHFSLGMTAIKNGIVYQDDIDDALLSARSIPLQEDEKIIHLVPTKYIIDGVTHLNNPLLMHGMRLEVVGHLITAHINSVKNIFHSCSMAGISVKEVVLEPIASSCSILNEQEKKLGSLLVDIGGGTSDVALYHDNALLYTEIIPIAGNIFTNDLSICLRVDKNEGERIKKICGMVSEENTPQSLIATLIDGNSDTEIRTSIIQEILLSRGEELGRSILSIIQKHKDTHRLPAGIILTGGGALLRGLPELFNQLTNLPVRIGVPSIKGVHNQILGLPNYATALGLILYGNSEDKNKGKNAPHSLVQKMLTRMKEWFLIKKIIE